jgi:hypothetical protein
MRKRGTKGNACVLNSNTERDKDEVFVDSIVPTETEMEEYRISLSERLSIPKKKTDAYLEDVGSIDFCRLMKMPMVTYMLLVTIMTLMILTSEMHP